MQNEVQSWWVIARRALPTSARTTGASVDPPRGTLGSGGSFGIAGGTGQRSSSPPRPRPIETSRPSPTSTIRS
eukprot:13446623-Heterocapsa_arctica.AAC.1